VSFSITTRTQRPNDLLGYSVRPSPMRACRRRCIGTKSLIVTPRFHGVDDAGTTRRDRRSTRHDGRPRRFIGQLLDLAAATSRRIGDAPWPPHFRKTEGEARASRRRAQTCEDEQR